MGTTSIRTALAAGLGAALLLGLASCAAAKGPAEPDGLQIRPVLAMAADADCEAADTGPDPAEPLTACDDTGEGYRLGPAEVDAADVSGAAAVPSAPGDPWSVRIDLDADGAASLAELTARLQDHPAGDPRNRLALVLDGRVIAAPAVYAAITGGQVLVAGDFTEEEATRLAERLGR